MTDRPEKIDLSDVKSRKVDENMLNELRDLFEKADEQKERYDFTWNGKAKAYFEAASPSTKTLKPDEKESVDFKNSENLFITGDNLEALKLMQESYLGKIDMIYIDPPYNTGKDFVYHDDFRKSKKEEDISEENVDEDGNRLIKNDKNSGRYHSDWLSMMFPRLKLARNLMSDQGIIFISIGEEEVSNLIILLKEIFGETSYVTTLIWEKKKKPSFLNSNIGSKYEYIVVFAKDRSKTQAFSVQKTTEGKKYPFNNAGNSTSTLVFPPKSIKFTGMSDQHVDKQDMSQGNIITKLIKGFDIINGTNKQQVELYGEWRYSQEKLNELINESAEITINSVPFRPNLVKKGGEIKKMHNLLTIDQYNVPTNEDATEEFTKLMGGNFFDYTKPSDLIKLLIKSYTYNKKDALILDFFAGSGTTAEAVMKMNKEDLGNRKFILITLAENIDDSLKNAAGKTRNVIENSIKFLDNLNYPHSIDYIARERVRRAAIKHNDESGFRALSISDTNLNEDVFKKSSELKQDQLIMDIDNNSDNRADYELLYDVLISSAFEYNRPISIDTIDDKKIIKYDYFGEISGIVAYFGDVLTDDLIRKISALKPLIAVFKESTFDKSSQKVNLLEQFRITSPDTKVKVI